MRAYHWILLLRSLCLVALGMSAALFVDYTSAESHFCASTSGCGAVRMSGFGYVPLPLVGRVPVPAFGVVGFTLLFAATLPRSASLRRRLSVPLAYVMGPVALLFIALQFYLAHYCWMCLVVDAAALGAFLCALSLRGRGFSEATEQEESLTEAFRLNLWAWAALPTAVIAIPLLYPSLVYTSEVPASIRALYREGTPTFVEFFDFECPHCQDLSPRLKRLVSREQPSHLRFGYVPLPGHDGALQASRVSICAAEQGKEMEVVGALFEAGVFSSPGSKEIAERLVPDQSALAECLASKRPEARLTQDLSALTAAGFEGLPTTYIGGTRILGAREDLVYFDALRRARDGSDQEGLSPPLYFSAAFLLLIALVLLGRPKAGDARSRAGT